MRPVKKDPDFNLHAKSEFKFLLDERGFKLTDDNPTVIQYRSAEVMVEVSYCGLGEVDVIIDEIPPAHRFQLRLFFYAYHPGILKSLGPGIASSDQEVRRELNRLSYALQMYGKQILEHDGQTFERMKTIKPWQLDG